MVYTPRPHLLIQVLSRVDHDGGRALQGKVGELAVQLVGLGKPHAMAVPLGLPQ